MGSELEDLIRSLDNRRAIVAVRALIAFLDMSLQGTPRLPRTARADTTNLAHLIGTMPETATLSSALKKSNVSPDAVAMIARGLLMVVLELGYSKEVDQACEPVLLYALGPGKYSGADTVAALTAVLVRLPQQQRRSIRQVIQLADDAVRLGSDESHITVSGLGSDAVTALDQWLERVTSDVMI